MRTIVIEQLSPKEKLDLIDELWESLEAEDFPLTELQLAEIDRRLETADEDASRGRTLEQIVEKLRPKTA
jgi:putative addiction module component (TIGR02574 family)